MRWEPTQQSAPTKNDLNPISEYVRFGIEMMPLSDKPSMLLADDKEHYGITVG